MSVCFIFFMMLPKTTDEHLTLFCPFKGSCGSNEMLHWSQHCAITSDCCIVLLNVHCSFKRLQKLKYCGVFALSRCSAEAFHETLVKHLNTACWLCFCADVWKHLRIQSNSQSALLYFQIKCCSTSSELFWHVLTFLLGTLLYLNDLGKLNWQSFFGWLCYCNPLSCVW